VSEAWAITRARVRRAPRPPKRPRLPPFVPLWAAVAGLAFRIWSYLDHLHHRDFFNAGGELLVTIPYFLALAWHWWRWRAWSTWAGQPTPKPIFSSWVCALCFAVGVALRLIGVWGP
jgi:hypothetical protein